MLVEDVERLFGGRELDGQDAFAVVDGLRGALSLLGALAVGSAVLVEQRVVAVVGEAVAVVLPADPAVVEAVAVSVDPLYRVHAALGNRPLLAHPYLGVLRRRLQRLSDAQCDFLLRRLGRAIVGFNGLGIAVPQRGSGVREGVVLRGEMRRLVAGWCMVVLMGEVGWWVLLLQRRRLSCLLRLLGRRLLSRQRDCEGRVDIEGELGLGVLRLLGGTPQVFAQRRLELVEGAHRAKGHDLGLRVLWLPPSLELHRDLRPQRLVVGIVCTRGLSMDGGHEWSHPG